ncbi:MAG: hypothetical protein Q8O66_02880 [bacterium]|nr:hypothetical protein [bacterium]
MKQTTKRFLSLLISFMLFVASLIVYFNLIVPAGDEEQRIKAQAISREDFVKNQQAAISQVQKLISSYKGEGELRDVVSSVLPLSPDLAGAFAQLSGLAQVNKLLIQNVTVGIPINQNAQVNNNAGAAVSQPLARPFGSVDFQMKVVGSYGDFKSFLKNLETNIRIFDVKKITLESPVKPNQEIYNYDLTVGTYYQSP